MLLAAVAMLAAVLLKKKSLSMIVGFVLVLMPELLFSRGSAGYYLPLPLGLCRACGYLRPDDYALCSLQNLIQGFMPSGNECVVSL